MAYSFDAGIDPRKPLDPRDPCPPHWQEVDAHERSKLFWGNGSSWAKEVQAWEVREKERQAALQPA